MYAHTFALVLLNKHAHAQSTLPTKNFVFFFGVSASESGLVGLLIGLMRWIQTSNQGGFRWIQVDSGGFGDF